MSNLEIKSWNMRKRAWDPSPSLPHGDSIDVENIRIAISTQAEVTIKKKVGDEWVAQKTPTRMHDYIVELASGRRILLNHP